MELQKINEFKQKSLQDQLNKLQNKLVGKTPKAIEGLGFNLSEIYKTAQEVKRLSNQINEVVHSTGILLACTKLLEKDEKIVSLSLGAGASADGIDLVTDKRIAEFKFSVWNEDSSNGWRRRTHFADYFRLVIDESKPIRQFITADKKMFEEFMTGKSKIVNVLSKDPTLLAKYDEFKVTNPEFDNDSLVKDLYKVYWKDVKVLGIEELI